MSFKVCNADFNDGPIIQLEIQIMDLNLDTNICMSNVFVKVFKFPYDVDKLTIFLNSYEIYSIDLIKTDDYYEGSIYNKVFPVYGNGHHFPFDYYVIEYEVRNIPFSYTMNEKKEIYDGKYELSLLNSRQSFKGVKQLIFNNTWLLENNIRKDRVYDVIIIRQPEYDFIKFLFPLLLIIIIILLIPIIDIYSNKKRDVVVFSSFIIFGITYNFSIQNFLPSRISFCLPEIYSIITFVYSAVFLLGNTISKEYPLDKNKEKNEIYKYNKIAYITCFILSVIIIFIMYSMSELMQNINLLKAVFIGPFLTILMLILYFIIKNKLLYY